MWKAEASLANAEPLVALVEEHVLAGENGARAGSGRQTITAHESCLMRGGELAGKDGGAVAVKVAKEKHGGRGYGNVGLRSRMFSSFASLPAAGA